MLFSQLKQLLGGNDTKILQVETVQILGDSLPAILR